MERISSSIVGVFIFIIAVTISACTSGNSEPKEAGNNGNRKSPIAIASVKAEATYIKVVYGQPYRNGRNVFGDLVPYGEVWRTGANEATEITFTNTVLIAEEAIKAGTYSLFTIPEPDSFTVILNHELGQWGAFEYKEERDYKRMKFPVSELNTPVEAFTIEMSNPEYSITTMSLMWDDVQVDIPIRIYGE